MVERVSASALSETWRSTDFDDTDGERDVVIVTEIPAGGAVQSSASLTVDAVCGAPSIAQPVTGVSATQTVTVTIGNRAAPGNSYRWTVTARVAGSRVDTYGYDPIVGTGRPLTTPARALLTQVAASNALFAALNVGRAFDAERNGFRVTDPSKFVQVFCLRNIDTSRTLFVERLFFSAGNAVGKVKTDFFQFRVLDNPAPLALALPVRSRLFGSSDALAAQASGPLDGTNPDASGTEFFTQEFPSAFPIYISPLLIDIALSPGRAFGVAVKLPADVTALTVNIGAQFYFFPAAPISVAS